MYIVCSSKLLDRRLKLFYLDHKLFDGGLPRGEVLARLEVELPGELVEAQPKQALGMVV